jgi:O-antigen ligase
LNRGREKKDVEAKKVKRLDRLCALIEGSGEIVPERRYGPRVLFISGLCLLFVFVSILPVTYLLSYAPGLRGLLVNALKFVPPAWILLLFATLAWIKGREGLKNIVRTHLVPSIIIFQVVVLVSSFGAAKPLLGLSRDFYYAITGPLVTLVVVGGFQGAGHLRRLVEVVFWTAVTVSVYGILEFILDRNPLFGMTFNAQNPFYAQFAQEGTFGARIRSSVGHPVFLGAYLLLIVPLGIALVSDSASKGYRILMTGGVLCIVAALLLTFSRGAWIGFGAGIAVYVGFWIWVERRWGAGRVTRVGGIKQVALVMAILVVFIALLLSFDKISTTVETRLRGMWGQAHAFKTDPRGVAYAQAAGIVADHPLLGIGTAHYRHLAKRYGDYDDTPDNGYLRALAENGVLGLGAMIAVFAGLLKALVRQAVKGGGDGAEGDEFSSHLAAALAAGFAGFFVDMITCDALQFPLTRMTFWMLAGVAVRIAHGAKRRA